LTSTGPIFAKFAGLVEPYLQINYEVSFPMPPGMLPWQPILLVLSVSLTIHKIGFAWRSVDGGGRQEVQMLRWTQANQLTDQ